MTAYASNRTRLCHGLLGSFPSLTGFTTDLLAYIANTLAMIRFRRTNPADFRGSLPNNLTIIAKHLNLTGLLIHFKGNTGRWLHRHGMGITDEECQIFTL